MSMKGKIYSAVAVLVLVAVVIVAVAIYGILNINSDVQALGRQAKRAVNLSTIDSIVLSREIGSLQLILATDPERKQELVKNYLDASEANMAQEIADYLTNFPEDATPEMLARPKTIQELWNVYVRSTNRVVETALHDSAQEAHATAQTMTSFWAELSREIDEIINSITNDVSDRLIAWRSTLLGVKTTIANYRFYLARMIDSPSDEETARMADEVRKQFNSLIESIASGASVPLGHGQRAAAMAERIESFRPTMEEVIRIGSIQSRVNALRLLNTEVEADLQKLEHYVADLIANSTKDQNESLDHAIARGRDIVIQSLIVAVVGILLGLLMAWRTISTIVGRLNSIISELGEASHQVQSASGSISSASQELADGANEQAASLEETSSALEQMASMTRMNADNATKTNDTTIANNKAISVGSQAVDELKDGIIHALLDGEGEAACVH